MSGVAGRALEVLRELARHYSAVREAAAPAAAKAFVDAVPPNGDRSFLAALGELASLRPDDIPAGPAHDEMRRSALRYLALGWLHGWAAFSLVAARTAGSVEDAWLRDTLLAPTGATCLGALLAAYATLRDANVGDEPLRDQLGDGLHVFALGTYLHDWLPGERPSHLTSQRFIPAAGMLVGKPADATRPDRDLLSLWGIVNLQIDAWCIRPTVIGGEAAAQEANRSALVAWLEALAGCAEVRRCFDLVTRSPGSELQDRVKRIGRFFTFRETYAVAARREEIIEEIAVARQAQAAGPPDRVRDLVEAAAPVAASGERLHEASIWLAWVVLVSFRDTPILVSSRAADGSPDRESFLGVWRRWNLPGHPAEPLAPSTAPEGADLRWNTTPRAGHANRLRADATACFLAVLAVDWDILKEEQARRALIEQGRPSPQGYQRRLDRCAAAMATIAAYGASPLTEGEVAAALRSTASLDEQRELVEAIAALEARLAERSATARALLEADRIASVSPTDTGRRAAWSVALAGATPGLAMLDVRLQAIPTRSFDALGAALEAAIRRMGGAADEAAEEAQLRQRFADARTVYRARLAKVMASRLGERAAALAVRVAEHRHRIAELDVSLGELHVRAARLAEQAAGLGEQARAERLALATRFASLAEARLEAVRSLGPHLAATVKQAKEQLAVLAKQARAMARQIREERERSFLIGLVKAIVSVVGAVLTPFTGGTSSVVASLITKGIDFVDTASKIDWSHLGVAVGQLADASHALLGGMELGLQQLGVKAPEALGKIRGFLRDPSAALDGLGHDLVDQLRGLARPELARLASAIASGFPLAVDKVSQRIRLDGLAQVVGVSTLSAGLAREVRNLFLAGGYVCAEVEQLGATLGPAIERGAQDLRAALAEALGRSFRLLDDDTLGEAFPGADLEQLRARFAQAKVRLAAVVDDAAAFGDEQLRSLAALLARGALFVEDAQDRIVLWPREAAAKAHEEAERLRRAFQREVHERWSEFEGPIQRHLAEVQARMREILSGPEPRDSALGSFAEGDLQDAARAIDEQLGALSERVDAAMDDATDQQQERRVASFDRDAALAALGASQAISAAAAAARTRAGIGLDLEELVGQSAELGAEQAALEQDAEELGLELEAARLSRAYLACVARGFSPADETKLNAKGGVTALLGDPRGATLGKASFARDAAEAAASMLAWHYFLDLPRQGGPAKRQEWFETLIKLSRGADVNAASWTGLMNGLVDEMTPDESRVRGRLLPGLWFPLSDRRFHWWEDLEPVQRDVWLSRIPRLDPAVVAEQRLLCVFRAKVYLGDGGDLSPFACALRLNDFTTAGRARVYAHTPKTVLEYSVIDPHVVTLPTQLWFLVAPPVNPRASELVPTVAAPEGDARATAPIGALKDAVDSLTQEITETQVVSDAMGAVARSPALVGAYGEWTGALVSNHTISSDERQALRAQVRARLHFALVAVGTD